MTDTPTETPEAQAPPGRPPVVTPVRVLAGLCLVAPFVATLWVSSYADTSPDLGGVPFFYWYQLLWVPLSALLTVSAYLLVRREERQRRVRGGGDAR
ncbi:DUF3311 domain-containing protein [Streptacidiphilus sp. ASG 303]|uniref:DUF3311 domain-containing protein n=1 Tax=Streptomycetaceae TaxID=2062 RepID=UPI001E290A74|nr:DUF3311 domain-containing protein [Streptacidiphilus sp. ASG 303]MCD0482866.1 DUF3311 domain-containing protein [Streptacidiphilus sp. ASG 303]